MRPCGIMDHGKVLLERSLAQLQDNMVKMQVVFRDPDARCPPDCRCSTPPGWAASTP